MIGLIEPTKVRKQDATTSVKLLRECSQPGTILSLKGEKYKIGTATAVCWKRDPNRFISTADKVLDASQNVEENGVIR